MECLIVYDDERLNYGNNDEGKLLWNNNNGKKIKMLVDKGLRKK